MPMTLREAYRKLTPAAFRKMGGLKEKDPISKDLLSVYEAIEKFEKYHLSVASNNVKADKKVYFEKIKTIGDILIPLLKTKEIYKTLFDDLYNAIMDSAFLLREQFYDDAVAALAYKPPQKIGAITKERKSALENQFKADAANRTKRAMRTLLDSCEKGYAANATPYTLELKKKKSTHYDTIVKSIDKKTGNPIFDENVGGAETVFKLKKTDNFDCETILVKKQQEVCLEAHHGEAGPPPKRDGKAITGSDVEAVIEVATRAIQIARGLCPNGTFNNAKAYKEKKLVYQSPTSDLRWLISKSETIRAVLGRLYKPVIGQKETPLDPQNAKDDGSADNFLREMAAMGKATSISQGGVCAQMSHLTVGILTMIAPPGMQICVVYDKAIDHSYTVLCGPNTDWFVCDPWPSDPHVIPWAYCCFPRQNILNHFLITVKTPVTVAYGIAFQAGHVKMALHAASKEINKKGLPDHEWLHASNLIVSAEERLIFKLKREGKAADAIALALKAKGYTISYWDGEDRKSRDWVQNDVTMVLQNQTKLNADVWVGDRPAAVTADDWGKVMTDHWKQG